MKLGRNSPCWCGSGKKFKKCHLYREQKAAIHQGALIQNINKHNRKKKCSVPEKFSHECKGGVIQAHTLSKSSSLKLISENGNVMGLKVDPGKHFKNNFDLEPSEIGIRRASTFTGFCAFHDRTIFSPIENHAFAPSKENCILLAYRAVARELYLKESSKTETAPLMKMMDSGQSLIRQFQIQMMASDYELGTDMAIEDLTKVKKTLDSSIENNDQTLLTHYVFKLRNSQKIASSGSIIIDYDFKGNMLQDLTKRNLTSIVFNCFPTKEEGYFIFTWLTEESAIAEKFIDSIITQENIGDRLTSFLFSYCENTFVTPSWWRCLEKNAKNRLKSRIQDGLKTPLSSSTLKSDEICYNSMIVDQHYYL